MKKSLIRIVAFLLVSCLVLDPVTAGGLAAISTIEKHRDDTFGADLFSTQALSERVAMALRSDNAAPGSFVRRLALLLDKPGVERASIQARGLEHIPKSPLQSFLIAANHPFRGLEAAVVTVEVFKAIGRYPRFLQLLPQPYPLDAGGEWLGRNSLFFPVESNAPFKTRTIVRALEQPGTIIGILPAGHPVDSFDEEMPEWKDGVARIARMANVFVVPAFINAREEGPSLDLVFGAPVSPVNKQGDAKTADDILAEIKTAVRFLAVSASAAAQPKNSEKGTLLVELAIAMTLAAGLGAAVLSAAVTAGNEPHLSGGLFWGPLLIKVLSGILTAVWAFVKIDRLMRLAPVVDIRLTLYGAAFSFLSGVSLADIVMNFFLPTGYSTPLTGLFLMWSGVLLYDQYCEAKRLSQWESPLIALGGFSVSKALGNPEWLRSADVHPQHMYIWGAGFRFSVGSASSGRWWFVPAPRPIKPWWWDKTGGETQDLLEFDGHENLIRAIRIYKDISRETLERGDAHLDFINRLLSNEPNRIKLLVPESVGVGSVMIRIGRDQYRFKVDNRSEKILGYFWLTASSRRENEEDEFIPRSQPRSSDRYPPAMKRELLSAA